jgi:hypothetical protein
MGNGYRFDDVVTVPAGVWWFPKGQPIESGETQLLMI